MRIVLVLNLLKETPMQMFFIQFFLVLAAILIGIRRGGIALGLIGGLGVTVLVFVFRVAPSDPPIAVMLIILAVVTASAALQVAGGLDYLVQLTALLCSRLSAPSSLRFASAPDTPSIRCFP
jgi:anaerobic C4-dicarboxylate transporter